MRILSRKPTAPYGIISTAVCLVVLVLGIVLANRAHAASQEVVAAGDHLITLHDGAQDRGILTSATTLRQAFKEAGIQIDPNDMVEPGLDEVLVASHYDVNVYRARPVTVIDGSLRTKILSAYQTPEQIVSHADIGLRDEDETIVSVSNDMVSQGAGLQVTIDRATPFTFVMYGKRIAAYTQGSTVGEMLEMKNVELAHSDMLSTQKATPITAGMTVELWREGKQTVTEEADVPFEIEKTQDADRELGYRDVKTPGILGKRTVSYEIEMKNGVEISRKEIQSVTTKEPVKQVEV
ncbi:MAG TPA: G5 domain-containing protein, partial [Candidatus Saccharimonadales bacterium]|nr:G5 domain-containing protein [Candidatus Saccharimonadales bacterium]